MHAIELPLTASMVSSYDTDYPGITIKPRVRNIGACFSFNVQFMH
ncbi:MAG: hypothetical protein Q7U98_20100 [Methylicorpusculum sp.]|nr:hypothetical protein [Methylicorpusculum sp.]MDO8941467.1 hypothetical protein [Methylicorpusculum sp.]MDO9240267.1 hypothetical protein [Methylicorpusculum sp.]